MTLTTPDKLTRAQLKALAFVATHPGTRRRAFLGYRYYFNEPTLKRSPFTLRTLEILISKGYVNVSDEDVKISDKGLSALQRT